MNRNKEGEHIKRTWTAVKQVEGMLISESTRHLYRGATCIAVKEELYIYWLAMKNLTQKED